MTQQITLFALLAIILGSLGMYLMLPRGNKPGRLLGGLLGLTSLCCLAMLGQCLGGITDNIVYGVVSTTAVISAAMAVTFRSPVYCAIWFALSLLATAGLFMIQGAQFLGVATVVVYAGAILVTFLFVLMLAQPGGQAFYDRVSWEGPLAATTGAILVGVLTITAASVLLPNQSDQVKKLLAADQPAGIKLAALGFTSQNLHQVKLLQKTADMYELELVTTDESIKIGPANGKELRTQLCNELAKGLGLGPTQFIEFVVQPYPLPNVTDTARRGEVLHSEHVAKLGGQMFSKHLIAVEVAGTLLLVALVGAIAILGQDKLAKQLPMPQDTVPVAKTKS